MYVCMLTYRYVNVSIKETIQINKHSLQHNNIDKILQNQVPHTHAHTHTHIHTHIPPNLN